VVPSPAGSDARPCAEAEQSDDELAAEDVEGKLAAVVPLPSWQRIRRTGLEHAVLVAAELAGPATVDVLLHQVGLALDSND
jgi:hypothetical protein